MKQTVPGIEKLDEIVQLSILYDFYGELLSDHKKQVFEDYILNDLSLSEIASEKQMSRQGIHDIVKRCSQELRDYEDKLSLAKKFQSVKEKLNAIKDISARLRIEGGLENINKIEELADDILKEL